MTGFGSSLHRGEAWCGRGLGPRGRFHHERVNRLELGVCDRGVRQQGEIGPLGERAKVLDRLLDPGILRWDEVRPMR
jgi:hypothetical protein